MAGIFAAQLEPFEENQSPSPTREDTVNPYELSLQRSISPSRRTPSSPNQSQLLHRQLSGAESPSPPWQQRRLSNTSRSPPKAQSQLSAQVPSAPQSRRHPSLTMTPSGLASPVDSAAIDDAGLGLPNRPFARSGRSSNRSSTYSQDLSTLTSEELWALDSNIRPLDHARRYSRIEGRPNYAALPPELIWPDALNNEELYQPPQRTQSVMSISSLAKKKTVRKRGNRTPSGGAESRPPVAIQTSQILGNKAYSTPTSPVYTKNADGLGSSRNSSSTSIASYLIPGNKSYTGLPRPPSAYYSRDFLSGLAARDGGYAIAREIGGMTPGSGANSPVADERRRSGFFQDGAERPRPERRAPPSKSSGMGRWSLDGGEHYGKPYATPSASTTQSNLYTSPDPSPPAEEPGSEPSLPEGAPQPTQTDARALEKIQTANLSSSSNVPSSTPVVSSPLAQAAVTAARGSAPLDSAAATPVPSPQKSKKEVVADAKAAKEREKAEAVQQNKLKAQAARNASLAKEKEREEAKRQAKADKQKAKDEEKRKKAEAKKSKLRSASSTGLSLFSGRKASTSPTTPIPSVPALPAQSAAVPNAIPALRNVSAAPSSTTASSSHTPVTGSPALTPAQSMRSVPSSAAHVSGTASSETSPAASVSPPVAPRQMPASLPPQARPPVSIAQPGPAKRNSSLGMFGTIRKRFSIFGLDKEAGPGPLAAPPAPAAEMRSPPSLPTLAHLAPIPPPVPAKEEDQPVVASFSINDGYVQPASDLPPRASSRGASPSPASPPQLSSPTQPVFATAPSSPTPGAEGALVRATSAHSGVSHSASSNAQAHERPVSMSGASLGRTSSGPRGPRAMPSSPPLTRSRTASVASASLSATGHHIPAQSSQATLSSSHDVHPPQIPPGAAPAATAFRPGLAPALSGMSDSLWGGTSASAPSSHSAGTDERHLSDLASPWSGSGSRKSSMTSAESPALLQAGPTEEKREKDGSKSSNETIHADSPPSLPSWSAGQEVHAH